MSQTEINTGKLIPVSEPIDELAEKHVVELPHFTQSKEEAFREDPEYYGFVELNGQFYKIAEHEHSYDMYFANVNKNEDGSIDFHTMHYNGGGHWTEVIEQELKRQEET